MQAAESASHRHVEKLEIKKISAHYQGDWRKVVAGGLRASGWLAEKSTEGTLWLAQTPGAYLGRLFQISLRASAAGNPPAPKTAEFIGRLFC